jgi:hypothetical protein
LGTPFLNVFIIENKRQKVQIAFLSHYLLFRDSEPIDLCSELILMFLSSRHSFFPYLCLIISPPADATPVSLFLALNVSWLELGV